MRHLRGRLKPGRTCTCSTTQATTSSSGAVIAANSSAISSQGQVDPDAWLELVQERDVAELLDHLHERVADGDRPVPVEREPSIAARSAGLAVARTLAGRRRSRPGAGR